MTRSYEGQTNRLLGYPTDARLLIINADDFGMCHAVNAAIFHALNDGLVQSTSLMTPCPWAPHAMNWLRENPQISFAVHLTVICEASDYRWEPIRSKDKVPSLLDENGNLFGIERMDDFAKQAKLDEVEAEFRAQIETVLDAGLNPTHLDWHCLRNGGRADIFDLTVSLARECGLAVRAYDSPFIEQLQAQGLPALDHPLLDSYSVDTHHKASIYSQMLRELPPGLSEWAVHPGLDTPEMRTLEPEFRVRPSDYDFVMSDEARIIIEQEGIILLDYKPLQAWWRAG